MKKLFHSIFCVFLLLGIVGQAGALTITSSTVTLISEESVSFPNYGDFVGDATIIGVELTDLNTSLATVEYSNSDFDASNNGFRWFERIYNNTGFAWSGYFLSISAGEWWTQDAFSGGSAIPDEAISDFNSNGDTLAAGSADGEGLYVTTITLAGNQPIMNIAGDQIFFDFSDSPILSGSFLELHVPFINLPGASLAPGEFIIAQQAIAAPVPEPATMMLFGIGLLGLAGVSRRKK